MLNQKLSFLTDCIFKTQISWDKTLDTFEKQHSSLLNLHIMNNQFSHLIIPEAVFQGGTFRLGVVGALNMLIN